MIYLGVGIFLLYIMAGFLTAKLAVVQRWDFGTADPSFCITLVTLFWPLVFIPALFYDSRK